MICTGYLMSPIYDETLFIIHIKPSKYNLLARQKQASCPTYIVNYILTVLYHIPTHFFFFFFFLTWPVHKITRTFGSSAQGRRGNPRYYYYSCACDDDNNNNNNNNILLLLLLLLSQYIPTYDLIFFFFNHPVFQ